MNPYEAIKNYLVTIGVTVPIYVDTTPPEPDTLLVINSTPGIYDPNNILQPYNKGTFQLYSRGDPENTFNILEYCYDYLQGLAGVTLSGIYFVEIVSLQDTNTSLGKDSLNRNERVQNYRFEVYKQTRNRE